MNIVKLEDVAIESRESLKEKDSTLPVVGLEHIIPEQINLTEWDNGIENTFTKIFQKGDVLFGRRRAYLKKAAVAPCKGICSGDITVIRAKEDKIIPELLPFIIQNDEFFDYAVGKSAGSLSPRVKWENLANYEFNLPRIEEQKKLAATLWQIVATMESYKKLLAKTDEMVKAKFVEMFGDPFKNEKNIASYKGSDFLILSSGKSHNIDENSIYPCYGGNGITGYVKDYFVEKPTIVIGRVGAYCGNVTKTLEKSWITDNAIYIKEFKANIFDIDFLLQLFKFHDFHKLAEFCGQPKITQAPILNSTFICPELSQQKKYVNFVQKNEESKAAIQASLVSLSAVYKKIIAENLGGSN